jgi:hypothetical protein
MKIATYVFASVMLGIPHLVLAAKPACSIRPPKNLPASELPALAKISRADAEKNARAALKTTKAVSLVSSELEVEKGCLLWSFDLRVPNRQGVREVWIDAGNGKVLASRYETPRKEAAEQKKDASRPTPAR